ncbi:aspartate-alanine antiporter [uncultured Duncaniella sp.]|uniref:aspartate-alanine antiporter n=1 Tax=uncultured Duncaniella sp. TaxID=2768039 RepID=UPI002618177D|nr:aspartate-alanine antiporter [uncultured Duncaniella sp.]
MIQYLGDILRNYPTLAVFLTVGLGFLLGRVRIGSFSLGSVTAVLLVGVIVGQFEIPMSGPLKTVFFMMFLFSIGYSVGPEFFKSLRGIGLKQVFFAVFMSMSCFAVTIAIAYIFSYSKGETVGLFSGSQTCSSLIGVGSEAILKLPIDQGIKDKEIAIIPVCYAVTYIFGTLGTVILLGNFGPKLLGGIEKVRQQAVELEKSLENDSWKSDPSKLNAHRGISFRAYRLTGDLFKGGRTVAEAETFLSSIGLHVYISRVQQGDKIYVPTPSDTLGPEDIAVICGPRKYMVKVGQHAGIEVENRELLTYPVGRLPVLVTSREVIGLTVAALMASPLMRGISIRRIKRKGKEISVKSSRLLERNDMLTLIGNPETLTEAGRMIGHADPPTTASDLMFVGLAIFIGGFIGTLTVWVGGVPVSFGTSGGALLAGIVFGWLRSKRPTFGQIPSPALWIMNNLGLNVFIAVVGIEAAPSFVSGLQSVGWLLFVAGAVGTTIPLLFGLWLGNKVFKFNPAITLGCCAGTRTCTASLGAVQDAIGSTVPAIGYTITYAVSNILLVVWGMVTVMLV